MTTVLRSEQYDFVTFLRDEVARNGNLKTSVPRVFCGDIPADYVLHDGEIEQLLDCPEQLQSLDEKGFHVLDNTLGRLAVNTALEDGRSVCATALQKNERQLPRMRDACELLAKAIGAPAVFAALHITPDGEWGSGQHADVGWTFVYQPKGYEPGTKTWHLTPPAYDTLDEFLASQDPSNTDYVDGPHKPGMSVTLKPGEGLFIPTGWGHAGFANGRAQHISYGGALPNVPLANVYGD